MISVMPLKQVDWPEESDKQTPKRTYQTVNFFPMDNHHQIGREAISPSGLRKLKSQREIFLESNQKVIYIFFVIEMLSLSIIMI